MNKEEYKDYRITDKVDSNYTHVSVSTNSNDRMSGNRFHLLADIQKDYIFENSCSNKNIPRKRKFSIKI